jgi:adenine-specific DNA-methyltransferase
MSDSLTDLILSLTPEDGSSIGNGAMLALLRERAPGLTEDDYFAGQTHLKIFRKQCVMMAKIEDHMI